MKSFLVAASSLVMFTGSAMAAFNFQCEGTSNEKVPVVIQGYYRRAQDPSQTVFNVKVSLPSLGSSHTFQRDDLEFGQREGTTVRLVGYRSDAGAPNSIYDFVLELPHDYFNGQPKPLWKQGFAWVKTYETGFAVDDGAVLVCRSWNSR